VHDFDMLHPNHDLCDGAWNRLHRRPFRTRKKYVVFAVPQESKDYWIENSFWYEWTEVSTNVSTSALYRAAASSYLTFCARTASLGVQSNCFPINAKTLLPSYVRVVSQSLCPSAIEA